MAMTAPAPPFGIAYAARRSAGPKPCGVTAAIGRSPLGPSRTREWQATWPGLALAHTRRCLWWTLRDKASIKCGWAPRSTCFPVEVEHRDTGARSEVGCEAGMDAGGAASACTIGVGTGWGVVGPQPNVKPKAAANRPAATMSRQEDFSASRSTASRPSSTSKGVQLSVNDVPTSERNSGLHRPAMAVSRASPMRLRGARPASAVQASS